jgi:antibiotic biosynthesis monooxygenase (ABM) superfamily enzyme
VKTHVVMWRLKEQALGAGKSENAQKLKDLLLGLESRIPGLVSVEAGVDVRRRANSADVVLVCRFADAQALEDYHDHPAHRALLPFIDAVREDSRVVDFDA